MSGLSESELYKTDDFSHIGSPERGEGGLYGCNRTVSAVSGRNMLVFGV